MDCAGRAPRSNRPACFSVSKSPGCLCTTTDEAGRFGSRKETTRKWRAPSRERWADTPYVSEYSWLFAKSNLILRTRWRSRFGSICAPLAFCDGNSFDLDEPLGTNQSPDDDEGASRRAFGVHVLVADLADSGDGGRVYGVGAIV